MVHVAGSKVAVARFLIALLIVFNFIQRYSPPLTGVFAGGIRRVKTRRDYAVVRVSIMYL